VHPYLWCLLILYCACVSVLNVYDFSLFGYIYRFIVCLLSFRVSFHSFRGISLCEKVALNYVSYLCWNTSMSGVKAGQARPSSRVVYVWRIRWSSVNKQNLYDLPKTWLMQIGLVPVEFTRNLDSCRARLCVNASHKYAFDFMFSRSRALGLVLVLAFGAASIVEPQGFSGSLTVLFYSPK